METSLTALSPKQISIAMLFLLATLLSASNPLGYEDCVSQLIGCLFGIPLGLSQHSTHDPYLLWQLCVDVVGALQYTTNIQERSYAGVMLIMWMGQILNIFTISLLRSLSDIQLTVWRKTERFCNRCSSSKDSNMVVYSLLSAATLVCLLLKSGDIELNPGPENQFIEDVDNSVILTEEHLTEVLDAVKDLSAKYYQLGVRLGLQSSKLDDIRSEHVSDVKQALIEILKLWLNLDYPYRLYGSPTWQRLVESVNPINHRIARSIASQHQKDINSEPEVTFTGGRGCRYERFDHESDKLCRDSFVAYYLRQVDECVLPMITRSEFVNVVLIKDQTSWRETVTGSMDEVVFGKETSSYNTIIQNIEHLTKKCILMEGRPGSGKTTLMNKISCDWAKGNILQSKLLIYVPLRKLSAQLTHNLFAIIGEACPPLKGNTDKLSKLVSYITRKEGEGVVFAFDGLDEYKSRDEEVTSRSVFCCFKSTTSEQTAEDTVYQILSGQFLCKAIVLVTSRPSACARFRVYAGRLIEVIGFLKDQIIEYIQEYFKRDSKKAEVLISHLHQHPNLMNMAYLPLHCAMLTVLFDEEEILPETETQVYRDFTLSTLARSISKKRGAVTSRLTEFHQLPPDERETFYKVCELAYNATIESKLVFSSSDMNKIAKPSATISDDTSLGLVVIDHYFMRHGRDATYTFLHLTFQEYLAAVYVIHKFNDKRIADFIKQNCRNEELAESAMWKFLCGMINFDKTSARGAIKELLLNTSDPLNGICYAYEAQHQYPSSVIVNHLIHEGSITFSRKTFTATDCAALGFVIRSGSKRGVKLILNDCDFNTEGATSLLRHIEDKLIALQMWRGEALHSILQSIEHIPAIGLRCLILKKTMIRDKETVMLKKALEKCFHLEDLNLWNNEITSVGAEALRDGLMHCRNLIKLNLINNKLGDLGVRVLESCFVKCDNLTTLLLRENGLTDNAVASLCKVIHKCKSLSTLQVTHNKFTDRGKRELEEARVERNKSSQFSELTDVNFV